MEKAYGDNMSDLILPGRENNERVQKSAVPVLGDAQENYGKFDFVKIRKLR